MELTLYNTAGGELEKIEVAADIFERKMNTSLIHSLVVAHQANQRRGTAATKTRGLVRGGGVKPWKQKGTGRARAGSIRSPLWRGGGVIFGPQPRSYNIKLPKQMKKEALKVVLSDRAAEGKIKVLDEIKISAPKTKEVVNLLKKFGIEKQKTLLICDQKNEQLQRASANLQQVNLVQARNLNAFDVLGADWVLILKPALDQLNEVIKK